MGSRTAITVNRPMDETRRMWDDGSFRPKHITETGAAVTFREAPGDRGTEITSISARHLARQGGRGGREAARLRAAGEGEERAAPLQAAGRDGRDTRSEGTPEGERAQRKFKQRPAQPLEESELAKAGV